MKDSPRKRILLADDDEALLLTLTDYLVFEGFEVVQARDGKEALSSIDEKVPDILILDISMPVMGGIEVLKRIQAPDGKLKCPTLVLTARSVMEGFFRGIAIDGFLAKPCSQDELVGSIRRILSAKAGETKRARRTRRKLLVGEDEPARILQMEKMFGEAGYDLVVVGTGPAILERAAAELPDGILIKEILPLMNGSVVASLVRVMPSTRSIPVVLYDETRGAGDAEAVRKAADGATVLTGPADPRRLLESVVRVLGT